MLKLSYEVVYLENQLNQITEWVIRSEEGKYLHSDGVFRDTVWNEGVRTGSYRVVENAIRRIAQNGEKEYLKWEVNKKIWETHNVCFCNDSCLRHFDSRDLYLAEPEGIKIDEIEDVLLSQYLSTQNPDCYQKWTISINDPRLEEEEAANYRRANNLSKPRLSIHTDGKIHETMSNDYNQFTGYFATKEDALLMMEKFGITEYREFIPGYWETRQLQSMEI